MSERPITFPKIREGFYRNAETGVHAFKVSGGYLPCTENRYGTSVPITDGPCATLKQARGIVARTALRLRDEINAAHAAALAEDAERLVASDGRDALIHYWTPADGDDVSACGVNIMTTPYTFGSPEWSEVTCKPCEATRPAEDGALTTYGAALDVERAEDVAEIRESDHAEALAEERRRFGIAVGDLVVFADPDDTGIDTDTVWRVSAVHAVGTINAYADLTGHAHDGRSASYFDRLAPAPRCTVTRWGGAEHGFSTAPVDAGADRADEWFRCGRLRSDAVHNTDRARAERTIHAARDHVGVATGTPYGGEWPGTTVVTGSPALRVKDLVKPVRSNSGMAWHVTAIDGDRVQIDLVRGSLLGPHWETREDVEFVSRPAPADVNDESAWAGYVATLPAPSPEAMAEVAVEVSTWTSHRANAVEGFKHAARTLWSLRADGMALPGSDEYRALRSSMRTFRDLIATCDRQNDALRREITHA